MKKLTAIVLTASLTLFFWGCAKKLPVRYTNMNDISKEYYMAAIKGNVFFTYDDYLKAIENTNNPDYKESIKEDAINRFLEEANFKGSSCSGSFKLYKQAMLLTDDMSERLEIFSDAVFNKIPIYENMGDTYYAPIVAKFLAEVAPLLSEGPADESRFYNRVAGIYQKIADGQETHREKAPFLKKVQEMKEKATELTTKQEKVELK